MASSAQQQINKVNLCAVDQHIGRMQITVHKGLRIRNRFKDCLDFRCLCGGAIGARQIVTQHHRHLLQIREAAVLNHRPVQPACGRCEGRHSCLCFRRVTGKPPLQLLARQFIHNNPIAGTGADNFIRIRDIHAACVGRLCQHELLTDQCKRDRRLTELEYLVAQIIYRSRSSLADQREIGAGLCAEFLPAAFRRKKA